MLWGCAVRVGPATEGRPAASAAESRVLVVIDLKLLRDDPDVVRRSQLSRGEDPALVDVLLAADTARRAAISTADTLRAEQKAASKKVGSAAPTSVRPAGGGQRACRTGQERRKRAGRGGGRVHRRAHGDLQRRHRRCSGRW